MCVFRVQGWFREVKGRFGVRLGSEVGQGTCRAQGAALLAGLLACLLACLHTGGTGNKSPSSGRKLRNNIAPMSRRLSRFAVKVVQSRQKQYNDQSTLFFLCH